MVLRAFWNHADYGETADETPAAAGAGGGDAAVAPNPIISSADAPRVAAVAASLANIGAKRRALGLNDPAPRGGGGGGVLASCALAGEAAWHANWPVLLLVACPVGVLGWWSHPRMPRLR